MEVTEEEFKNAIDELIDLRRTRHAGDFSDFFKEITDNYTLEELRSFISKRFFLHRVPKVESQNRIISPNMELISFERTSLKKISKKFRWGDKLWISFCYDDNWNEITKFRISLYPEEFFGGLLGAILLSPIMFIYYIWDLIKKKSEQ